MKQGFLIEKVCITNFRGYSQKEFDLFPNKDSKQGIVLLGGANGYGKTSFLDAIEWCLTGSVKRLENELRLRKETSKKQKIGILRNTFCSNNEAVRVSIVASYKDKKVLLTRSFNENDDSLGLGQGHSNFSIQVEGLTIDGESINDFFGFFNNDLNIDLAKTLYQRFVCSFDKNLDLYKKGRADFYEMFSAFFGGTDEIEQIINNLEGYEEKINRKKIIHPGLINELSQDIITEKHEITKKEKEVAQAEEQYKNSLNQLSNQSINVNLSRLPRERMLQNDANVENLIMNGGLNNNIGLIRNNVSEYSSLLRYIDIKSYANYVSNLNNQLKKRFDLQYFNDELFESFIEKENIIKDLQGLNSSILQSNINFIEQGLLDLKNTNNQIKDLQVVRDLRERFTLRSVTVEEINAIEELFKKRGNLKNDLSRFDTDNSTMKALHAIIDHLEDYNHIRQNGNDSCLLCGSVFFKTSTLGLEARKLLGDIDSVRSSLVQQDKELSTEIYTSFSNLFNKVTLLLNDELYKSKQQLSLLKQTDKIQTACTYFNLEFSSITLGQLMQKNRELQNQSDYTFDPSRFSEDIRQKILTIVNHDKEMMANWRAYSSLSIEKKIQLTEQFVLFAEREEDNLNKRFKLNDMVTLEKINTKYVVEKIGALKELEKALESDQSLKEAEKKFIQLRDKLADLTLKFEDKNNKLGELKNILKRLKELRSHWDTEVVRQLNEPMQKIYRRLSRHSNIQSISLSNDGRTSQKASLLAVLDKKKQFNISNILSAGQLSVVSLSIFLTIAMGQRSLPFKCYFMDDPIQSMDDLNILSFVDLLRGEYNAKDSFFDQLFITTCNEDLEDLFGHKMNTFDVNLCHLHFESYGDFVIK